MPKTYYDSELTAEQIEAALTAIDGVVNPGNNGKVLYIENGKIKAASASRWSGGAVLEPLSVTANGDYTPPTGTDGFNSVHVAVPSAGNIQPLSVTENGTYNPPSGVDGYAPVTVNVSGGLGFITDYTVLADETVATFDQANQTWGDLSIGGTGAFATSDAVRFPQASTMADASYAYFDFGAANQPATVYFVGKLYETPQYSPSNNLRMISSRYAESARNTQEFMSRNGLVLYGQYGDPESSVTSSASSYSTHVLAMRIDQTNKKVTQFIDGIQVYDQTFNNFGQNIYFAAQPNFPQSYMSACPLEVNRIIITSGPDKTRNMLQNILYLMTQYSIGM